MNFEVSFSGGVHETTDGNYFTYYNDLSVNDVQPRPLSMYAGTNNVQLDIYGNFFINSADLRVRIDDTVISAITYISDTHLQVIAPDAKTPGKKYIWVANNA